MALKPANERMRVAPGSWREVKSTNTTLMPHIDWIFGSDNAIDFLSYYCLDETRNRQSDMNRFNDRVMHGNLLERNVASWSNRNGHRSRHAEVPLLDLTRAVALNEPLSFACQECGLLI
eukprot:scaffold303449_cov39-Prasinocladus_malaysianus.AAC.2